MIILGIVLSFAAIGILCWLLFTARGVRTAILRGRDRRHLGL